MNDFHGLRTNSMRAMRQYFPDKPLVFHSLGSVGKPRFKRILLDSDFSLCPEGRVRRRAAVHGVVLVSGANVAWSVHMQSSFTVRIVECTLVAVAAADCCAVLLAVIHAALVVVQPSSQARSPSS